VWRAADANKPSVWRCGKCGNSILQANRPLDRPCAKGGKCSWRKQS
jgi:ABC-type ATPase with predicted acetyltransferase domain